MISDFTPPRSDGRRGWRLKLPPLTGSDHVLPLVVAGTGAAMVCAEANKRAAIVAGAVGIGLAASKFPAGYFPYCASPAGGASAWCWRPLIFHGAIVQRENTAFARRQRGFNSHWLHQTDEWQKGYCSGLENRRGLYVHRGFESHLIRQNDLAPERPRNFAGSTGAAIRLPSPPGSELRGRFRRGGGLSFSLCSRSPWRAGESR